MLPTSCISASGNSACTYMALIAPTQSALYIGLQNSACKALSADLQQSLASRYGSIQNIIENSNDMSALASLHKGYKLCYGGTFSRAPILFPCGNSPLYICA